MSEQQLTNYTAGFNKSSTFLPYPHQADLPGRDQHLERYYAVSQWVELTSHARTASHALRDAWKEEQRDAGIAAVSNLLFERTTLRGVLRTILDYAECPEAPTVNAAGMTLEQRMVGIAGQAQFGIDKLNGR